MCDSILTAASDSPSGRTLFGKNSDRKAGECQPFLQFPEAFHPPASTVRCTHIEIPQSPHTFAVMGSSPWWVWGFEHGVNEYGVAIGNHSVFSHEPIEEEPGLIGMDLVRLGLERARDAREAIQVIAGLLEAHGQGGAAFAPDGSGYHNSFAIADATSAWMLETSNRRWVACEVSAGAASMSNHMALGSQWDVASGDLQTFARRQEWFSLPNNEDEPFDFAAAYRNPHVPGRISEGRARRSQSLLNDARQAGALDLHRFTEILRDHGADAIAPPSHAHPPATPEDESYYTLCTHNEVQGPTAASMVVELPNPAPAPAPSQRSAPWPIWISLATPCTGIFIPVYIDGVIPASLARGTNDREPESAWWRFQRLQHQAESDLTRHIPTLRRAWEPLEREIEVRRIEVEAETAASLSNPSDADAASKCLSEFMNEITSAALTRADELTHMLASAS